MTASRLRANLYRVLTRVADTGVPQDVVVKGKAVRITRAATTRDLTHLPRRPVISGDPEALVSIDWSEAWKP